MTLLVGAEALGDEASGDETAEALAVAARFELAALVQPPPISSSQDKRDRFAQMSEALANAAYPEAEIIAKQIVENVAADSENALTARALALHNLAVIQHHAANIESARQNYATAVNLIAREDNNLSPGLIQPLQGLAIAHLGQGRPDEAFAALDRAQHVSNVNFGPHSFEQLPLLQAKLQIHIDNGDRDAALEALDRIVGLYTRKFSKRSVELLPALYQKTELYRRYDMDGPERIALRHILDIKRANFAETDLALVEPNIQLATNYARIMRTQELRSVVSSKAERHFKTALWIAENSPESNWQVRKDCLLALADYYTLFGAQTLAHRYYSTAWELLATNEDKLAVRADAMERPVPLTRPKPDPYANFEYRRDSEKLDPADYLTGEIVLTFTVNDRGRAENIHVMEANPAKFSEMEKRVRKAARRFIYRPRYMGGLAVATGDQRYRTEYFYHQADYEASLTKSASNRRSRRNGNR
ncbi:MAG: tetratricopeptide repeat protein [Woeseiaceae bacterium]